MLSVVVVFFGVTSGVSVGGLIVVPTALAGVVGGRLEDPPPLGVATSVDRSDVGLGMCGGVPVLLDSWWLADGLSSSQFRNDSHSMLPSIKAGSAESPLPFEMTARKQA